MTIKFEDRNMTDKKYKREQIAFNEHGLEFGNPPEKRERFGYVATDSGKFVGASSGLADKNSDKFGKYFYLSDLLVEKEHRRKGYGKKLLELLENKIKLLGIEYILSSTPFWGNVNELVQTMYNYIYVPAKSDTYKG